MIRVAYAVPWAYWLLISYLIHECQSIELAIVTTLWLIYFRVIHLSITYIRTPRINAECKHYAGSCSQLGTVPRWFFKRWHRRYPELFYSRLVSCCLSYDFASLRLGHAVMMSPIGRRVSAFSYWAQVG